MHPVLLDLGWWQLRSYGAFVALAALVGIWWSAREGERRGFARETVYDFAGVVVVAGFVGARVYYALVSDPAMYLTHPWELLAVWHGGLAFQDGLLAAFATGAWLIRCRGLPFWYFADAIAPGLVLGQTVGQIACLLNGDTYGKPTTLPWAITFTDPRALAPLGVPLHPIQLYELLAYLFVFLVVQRVARSTAPPGAAVLAYGVFYGIARFVMELFRGDPPMVEGVIVPQAMSGLLVAVSVVALLVLRRRTPDTGSTAWPDLRTSR
jgi:phosphatidylglycerol:prolipoprotein diacylglycerol transferase